MYKKEKHNQALKKTQITTRLLAERYMNKRKELMKKLIFLGLLIYTNISVACGSFVIPVEVINEFNKTPTLTDTVTLRVVAPLKYESWELSRAYYTRGKSRVSVVMWKLSDYPDKGVFSVTGTSDFFEGSHLALYYSPLERKMEDGTVRKLACIHKQKIQWGI